jgi:hypothetical protein
MSDPDPTGEPAMTDRLHMIVDENMHKIRSLNAQGHTVGGLEIMKLQYTMDAIARHLNMDMEELEIGYHETVAKALSVMEANLARAKLMQR